MSKRVILVTGTPCVGKTSVSRLLASKLNAEYVNLTDLAIREGLISGKDKERDSIIVDENKMRKKLHELIDSSNKKDIVIDGHYAVSVVPKNLVTYIFVLRRDPVELKKLMQSSGFTDRKLWENLASEILDVCLVDALNVHSEEKVCELDNSGKSVEEIVSEILTVLERHKKCGVGLVDWLGKLETEGVLDDYLKI
jgi:adenylate kinase